MGPLDLIHTRYHMRHKNKTGLAFEAPRGRVYFQRMAIDAGTWREITGLDTRQPNASHNLNYLQYFHGAVSPAMRRIVKPLWQTTSDRIRLIYDALPLVDTVFDDFKSVMALDGGCSFIFPPLQQSRSRLDTILLHVETAQWILSFFSAQEEFSFSKRREESKRKRYRYSEGHQRPSRSLQPVSRLFSHKLTASCSSSWLSVTFNKYELLGEYKHFLLASISLRTKIIKFNTHFD